VSPLSIAYEVVSKIYNHFPDTKLLGIGGDHAASYPLVKAKLNAAQKSNQRIAVLQFDAHTDLLTQRMGIPITFGSWVPNVLSHLVSPDLWIQLGIRQTARDKQYWQDTFGIRQYWANEFKEKSVANIATEVLQHLKANEVDGIYITVDIDVLDASQVSATGTPETGGLLAHDVIELIQRIADEISVHAGDIMEFAPMIHHPTVTKQQEPDTTLQHILPIYAALVQALR
jgi:agmatinase